MHTTGIVTGRLTMLIQRYMVKTISLRTIRRIHRAQVTGAKLFAKRDKPWTPMAKRNLSRSLLDKLEKLNSVSTTDGSASLLIG